MLLWAALTVVFILCYNVFICYIYSIIKIPCNLMSLTISNFIVSLSIFLGIRKQKTIQKFYIRKSDIAVIFLFLIIVIVIANIHFGGFPFELNYESTDPATHYTAAREFYKSSTLLNNVEDTTIFNFKTMMPISYVNTGITFMIAENFLEEYQFYNIYVLIDLFILFVSGLLIYSYLKLLAKKHKFDIIVIVFSILYLLAYQLNSLIFGYAYLSVSLNIIISIFIIMKLKDNLKFCLWTTIMFLLNFGLFFGYYFFVPVVYASEGIFLLLNMIKNRKKEPILRPKNCICIFITLILPTILGFIYFVLPEIGKSSELIAVDGYIYKELYGDLLFYIPFVLFYIIYHIKHRKIDFNFISLIIGILYAFTLFIGGIGFNKVSSYYFYKTYYFLYIPIIITTCNCIYILWKEEKSKVLTSIILAVYIGGLVWNVLGLDIKLQNRNPKFNPEIRSAQIFPIYDYNWEKMHTSKKICTKNMLDIIYYYGNLIDDNKESVMIKGNNRLQRWMYALFGVTHHNNYLEFSEPSIWNTTEDWIQSDKQYLIAFYEEKLTLDNQEKYEIILMNDDGCILKRK